MIDVYDLDYPRNDVGRVVGELVVPHVSAESFAKYVKTVRAQLRQIQQRNPGRISSVACGAEAEEKYFSGGQENGD